MRPLAILSCAILAHFSFGQQPPQQPVRIQIQQQVQQQIQQQPGGVVRTFRPGRVDATMLIETSPPIVNLLARAEEGIAREDWKFAIDSLQRVIDDAEGSLVPCDDGAAPSGTRFESARRLAQRRIAGMPPEGLAAYRLLNDGSTKTLLERARIQHDSALLRSIVDTHLATTWGPVAADLLAAWSIDEGRPAEAMGIVSDALDLVAPDSPLKKKLQSKQVIARAMLADAVPAAGHVELPSAKISPERWVQGMEQIRAWSARQASALDSQLGSRFAREPVSPTITDTPVAEHQLPGSIADRWRRIQDDIPTDPILLPAAQLAFDAARIYVRNGSGCAALDPQDLSVLWETSRGTTAAKTRRANREQPRPNPNVLQMPPKSLDDFRSGSVSTAFGLVFLVDVGGDDNNNDDGMMMAPGAAIRRAPRESAQLVALDAATGKTRWTRGSNDAPQEELADVQFRSAPIAVHDKLWVPYTKQSDLYVAILNPADGAVVRTRLIGSMGQQSTSSTPIALSAHEGVVYVPTGFGVLFALSAENALIRWAAQYTRSISNTRADQSLRPPKWLPSPVLVAGDVVVIAPVDSLELLAFSGSDGSFRWSAVADGASYSLGDDGAYLWLGGRSLTCLNLSDGQRLWTKTIAGVPTGRGMLAGEMLHLPTSVGLLTFDTKTGDETARQPIPPSQAPLGNLASLGDSVYSIDPASVRKFLDIERAHAHALAALQANPADARSTMQLANVELVRGNPTEALKLLDSIRLDESESASPLASRIAAVRMQAVFDASENKELSPVFAVAALEQVASRLTRPEDMLRCRMRIAELQLAAEKGTDAHHTLLELGLDPASEAMVDFGEQVQASARYVIAQRLRRLPTQPPENDGRQLQSWIAGLASKVHDGSIQPAELYRLRALAELDFGGGLGHEASLLLAGDDVNTRHFERAERRIRGVIQAASDSAMSQKAWILLSRLYDRSGQNAPELLAETLGSLERQFGDQPLPDELHDADDDAGETKITTIGEWVVSKRSHLPPQERAAASATADVRDRANSPVLSSETAWAHANPDQLPNSAQMAMRGGLPNDSDVFRLISFPPGTTTLIQRVIGFETVNRLTCLDSKTGRALWQSDLRLPEDFRASTQKESSGPRSAFVDGQVGIFNSGDGLFAVGLATGRLLWVRPYDVAYDSNTLVYGDSAMAGQDGLLAAIPRDGRLSLLRTIDGSTIWERDLRGEPVHALSMDGSRIITRDAASQRIHIFDRANGQMIKQLILRQPDPGHEIVSLIHAGGKFIAPNASAEGDAVVAYDVADGSESWRAAMSHPIAALFEPQKGYVGVGLLGGDVRILNATTGEVILERSIQGARHVADASLIDGTALFLYSLQNGERRTHNLVAFDIATGDEVWRRTDVTVPSATPELSVFGHTIPIIVETERAEVNQQGVAQPRTKSMLSMLDVRTGLTSGNMIDVSAGTGVKTTGEVALYPGVLLVGTNKGLTAYKTATTPAAGNGKL